MKLIASALFVSLLVAMCYGATCKVTATELNIRKGPSTKYSVVGKATKDQVLTVLGTTSGFKKIGTDKYISGSYCTDIASTSTSTPTSTSTSGAKCKVTATTLNIRKGPSTKTDVVGMANLNQIFNVLGEESNFKKIGTNQYVYAPYCKATTESGPTTSASTPTSTPTTAPASASGKRQDSSPRPPASTPRAAEVVYYAQYDTRWASKPYTVTNNKEQTIKTSACGPTSMAMAVATFADKSVTPVTMVDYSLKHGYRTANSGTSWGFFCDVAKQYKLKCTQSSKTDDAVAAVKKGALVVASMGKGYWTQGGHYILLHSADSTNLYAHDPGKSTRYKATISLFKQQSKQYFIINK